MTASSITTDDVNKLRSEITYINQYQILRIQHQTKKRKKEKKFR